MVFMAFVRTDLSRSAEDQEEFERKWFNDWLFERLQQKIAIFLMFFRYGRRIKPLR
jgi:hypothetical protein